LPVASQVPGEGQPAGIGLGTARLPADAAAVSRQRGHVLAGTGRVSSGARIAVPGLQEAHADTGREQVERQEADRGTGDGGAGVSRRVIEQPRVALQRRDRAGRGADRKGSACACDSTTSRAGVRPTMREQITALSD